MLSPELHYSRQQQSRPFLPADVVNPKESHYITSFFLSFSLFLSVCVCLLLHSHQIMDHTLLSPTRVDIFFSTTHAQIGSNIEQP